MIEPSSGLLSYRVRVENLEGGNIRYLSEDNTIAIDQANRSYAMSPRSTLIVRSTLVRTSFPPGSTRVGTLILNSPLPAELTGTVLELRLGLGGAWNVKTLVPAA